MIGIKLKVRCLFLFYNIFDQKVTIIFNKLMDLSKFTSKSKGVPVQSHGFLKKNYYKLKYWVLPPTSDRRKERLDQYKNIGIFIGAIVVISAFEDKIKNFLEIETDDLRKMTSPGGF